MFALGDPVGLERQDGTWCPWRYVERNAFGVLLAAALEHQPMFCQTWDADRQRIALAAEVEFSQVCLECNRCGKMERWRRTRIAGPLPDEIAGKIVAPTDTVDCPVCEGVGRIRWDPFRERPGCVRPALFHLRAATFAALILPSRDQLLGSALNELPGTTDHSSGDGGRTA